MKITVLGLGRMGQAIANRLIDAGHDVTVWNRTGRRAGELVDQGAREAGSVDDAVSDADIVLTSLSGDDAVRAVLLPDGRAIDALPGAVVDCSTVSPETSHELADAYPNRFVACPIAGAPQAVTSGAALPIVGGPPAAIEAAGAALDSLNPKRHPAGADPATAARTKLLNNYLLMAGLAALAEAVAIAQANGLDDDAVQAMIEDLPVIAPALRNRVEHLIERSYPSSFTIDLGIKDLALFLELAASNDLYLPLAETVRARYLATAAAGHGDDDLSAVIEEVSVDA